MSGLVLFQLIVVVVMGVFAAVGVYGFMKHGDNEKKTITEAAKKLEGKDTAKGAPPA